MFENSPLVELAVGRSSVRQRLLALLMDESCGRLHLRELQRRADTSPGTASRELARLVAAGLIEREAEGSQVYFRASASPFATMLRSLLVAMPAPEFKPRPARLPRVRIISKEPAAAESVATAAEPMVVEGTAAEPVAAAEPIAGERAAALSAEPEVVEPSTAEPVAAAEPIAGEPAAATEPKVIAAVHVAPAPEEEPLSISVVVSQAASVARAAVADPVGMRIARQLSEPLKAVYGDRLRGFYLYGTRAAGPAAADADVETIVVLNKVDGYGSELERTSHMYSALSHDLKLVVSRVFVDESAWDGGPNGVLPAVRSEAVAV